MFQRDHLRKPDWLKIRIPSGEGYKEIYRILESHGLSTVCQEARCPNISECWKQKSATIMILGRVCTRACRFCAVATGNSGEALDAEEPERVARVIRSLGLKYVVITSVDRDDLEDGGSSHYAKTITMIRAENPSIKVEALIPDFGGNEKSLRRIVGAEPFVVGHNVETTRRLTPYIRDRRCGYDQSLDVLTECRDLNGKVITKSGLMVGLGEEFDEIKETLLDLGRCKVRIVTIGQYLQPTKKHHPVQKYYTPAEFGDIKNLGLDCGIEHVISGPLVRSSYHAAEIFE